MALDGVLSDLEAEGYEVGTVVVPACAVNAPHRRDRVWIVAYSDRQLRQSGEGERPGVRDKVGIERPDVIAGRASHKSEALADADRSRPQRRISAELRERADERAAGKGGPLAPDADSEPLGWPTEPQGKRGGGQPEPGLGRSADGLRRTLDEFGKEAGGKRVDSDQLIIEAVTAGHLIVDHNAGIVYRTRGSKGIALDNPVVVDGCNLNGYRACKLVLNGFRK